MIPKRLNSKLAYTVTLAVVCLFLAYLIGITCLAWFVQNDTLWHLKAGEYMVKHKTVLMHDVFSWTMPSAHWYSHEWFWEVMFYLIYKQFGFAGLFWVNVIILALILFISFFVINNLAGRDLFVITAVVGWGIYRYFVARPHVLAVLLFTVALFIVTRDKLNTKQLVTLALVFVLWANVHSSVVLGVFMVGLLSILKVTKTKKYKEAIKPAVIAMVASLISPHHIGTYYFFVKLTTAKILTDNIAEWHSPNFHDTLLLVLVIAWVATFVIKIRHEQKWWNNLVIFLIGLAMILSAIRNIVFVGLLFGIACQTTKDTEKQEEKWLSVFVFVLAATLMFSINMNNLKFVDEKTMLSQEWAKVFKAVDYMQQHGYTDRILNDYNLGAYLIFRGIKCSIDSRADMYYFVDPEFTEQYINCLGLMDDFTKLIKKLDVKYVWVGLQTPVAQYLKAKQYKILYSDKYTILFKVPPSKN